MKKNLITPALIVLIMMALPVSCKEKRPSDLSKESIIPKPVSVVSTGDYFIMKPKCKIFVYGESEEMKLAGQYLAEKLKSMTGIDTKIKTASGEPWSGNIFLQLSDVNKELGDEGYELTITKQLVKLTALKPAGLYRGVQTIRQVLSSDADTVSKKNKCLAIYNIHLYLLILLIIF